VLKSENHSRLFDEALYKRVDECGRATEAKQVVCAQDMGLVVNPEGAKIQMEGCITMGLGYALKEIV